MIGRNATMAQNLLPQTTTASTSGAVNEHLFTRGKFSDPERMGGEVVQYKSFDDFVATFDAEAKDPNVVGTADFLDIINPLQHIPLISQIYRELTNDQIKPGARIIGGAVFGGGVGLATSSVNAVVEEETGKDVPTNLIASLSGQDSFVRQDKALALNDSNTPEQQLNILLGNDQEQAAARSPQHVASAYRRVADTQETQSARPYERVVMADPERMAGSFARYA